MKDFAITLCLGWLGVHRFMQKKYGTGILWLCTFGLFGIGWIADIIVAFTKISENSQNKMQEQKQQKLRLVKTLHTQIVGTFADCDLDSEQYREDLILTIKKNQQLSLQYWEYNGEPAYYVMHPSGVDVGCLPKNISKNIYENYKECEFEVVANDRILDDRNNETCNIQIYIYR